MIKCLTAEERKDLLESTIASLREGMIVPIIDASYCAYGICIGDFVSAGMAEKNVWRDGMNWTWKGPGTIVVNGKIVEPGHQTEEIEMDWT